MCVDGYRQTERESETLPSVWAVATASFDLQSDDSAPAVVSRLDSNQLLSLVSAGVYFDSCVRQIKFVDFCGKYRLPLMHYLCSPECTSPCSSNPQSDADSEDENSVPAYRLQRVLLG